MPRIGDHVTTTPRLPHHRTPLTIAAICSTAAAALMLADIGIVTYVQAHSLKGDIRKLLDVSEAFAHGWGVLMILTTIAVLDPSNRCRLPRLIACAFGSGLVTVWAKLLLPRLRPNVMDLSRTAWDSFEQARQLASAGLEQMASRDIQSFPSGHAATAVGLAFGLSWLYPQGRWLFALFAVLASAQRVHSLAHFPSDTLAGAAIAAAVAGLCLSERGLGPWFSRWERRHVGNATAPQGVST